MKGRIDYLNISEKFLSIQGEGQTMGIPSVFIRLGGCNLLCQSAKWTCDTIEVWQKSNKVHFESVLSLNELAALRTGAHLVFTGGEPMLHQAGIIAFVEWFNMNNLFVPVIEVETNGTIMPHPEMYRIVDYWNCSPKLSNSGEPHEKRVKAKVLTVLNHLNTIFKFVIASESDLIEISEDFLHCIGEEKIVLMPAGESQEKLNYTRRLVARLCIENGYRYSERLHIVIWNQKTGV